VSKLFRDVTEGDEREDPYSGPHGFLLGVFSMEDIADQYFKAANLLVDSIKSKNTVDYELAYPVLYLYRHAIELILKSLMGSTSNSHRLDALQGDLVKFAREHFKQDVPSSVIALLRELASIDPTSQAFRYGEDRYDNQKQTKPVPYETYVRLSELHERLNGLYESFKHAIQQVKRRQGEMS